MLCDSRNVLLVRYDSEEYKVLVAVVYQTVRVSLRAVVALTGFDLKSFSVIEHAALSAEKVDDLAACIVQMLAYCRAGNQRSVKKTVHAVVMHFG